MLLRFAVLLELSSDPVQKTALQTIIYIVTVRQGVPHGSILGLLLLLGITYSIALGYVAQETALTVEFLHI